MDIQNRSYDNVLLQAYCTQDLLLSCAKRPPFHLLRLEYLVSCVTV